MDNAVGLTDTPHRLTGATFTSKLFSKRIAAGCTRASRKLNVLCFSGHILIPRIRFWRSSAWRRKCWKLLKTRELIG